MMVPPPAARGRAEGGTPVLAGAPLAPSGRGPRRPTAPRAGPPVAPRARAVSGAVAPTSAAMVVSAAAFGRRVGALRAPRTRLRRGGTIGVGAGRGRP